MVENTIGGDWEPITKVIAEDTFNTEGGDGRIDFVCYDGTGKVQTRIVGEAKFDAAPFNLAKEGAIFTSWPRTKWNRVLLFVVPEYRIEFLWGPRSEGMSRQ